MLDARQPRLKGLIGGRTELRTLPPKRLKFKIYESLWNPPNKPTVVVDKQLPEVGEPGQLRRNRAGEVVVGQAQVAEGRQPA